MSELAQIQHYGILEGMKAVKIAKRRENATYRRENNGAIDVASAARYIIVPGQSQLVDTGLSIEVPKFPSPLDQFFDLDIQVWARSGMSVKKNGEIGAGLIDSNYRGPVKLHLYNHGLRTIDIQPGDFVAQLALVVVYKPPMILDVPLEELSGTERGENGFGSTGGF